MIDLNFFTSAIKCSRIKKIMDDQNNGLWKQRYVKPLNKYVGKVILESKLNENIISIRICLKSIRYLKKSRQLGYK